MIRIDRSTERTDESTSNCLVNSFLQYLRHELRRVASNRTKIDESSVDLTNFDLNSFSHESERISALIDLLVVRVQCLSKGKSFQSAELNKIDKFLMESLYFLFKRFLENDPRRSQIDQNQFVSICQQLVRRGCFDFSSTISDRSNCQTLTEKSFSTSDLDDLTKLQSNENCQKFSFGPMCQLSSTTVDDQSQPATTDNYKTCESECSHSSYFSPNSSFDNIQSMVHQTFDQISTDFQSKKSMISADDLFKANDPLSSINSTNIYSGLTNQSLPGVEMTNEQNSIHSSDRMARKERKLHDQWFSSTKADSPNKKTNLFDIEFTPIAVLRRKFLDKTTENQQINSSTTTKTINPCQTNQFPSNEQTQRLSLVEKLSTMEKSEEQTTDNEFVDQQHQLQSEEEKEERLDENDEKKNNSYFTQDDYHASRILLVNDEPAQVRSIFEQKEKEEKEQNGVGVDDEKKEREERTSSLLEEQEQSNRRYSKTEDESNLEIQSKQTDGSTMDKVFDENEIYKKIELEEILDEEDFPSKQNENNVEPIDFILTDDENKEKTSKVNRQVPNKQQIDPFLFCYEKAFAKVVDGIDETTNATNSNKQVDTDPIALRALKRFEERMNAATAKSNFQANTLPNKGKSSWSTSNSATRKSIENLFKTSQPNELDSTNNNKTEQISNVEPTNCESSSSEQQNQQKNEEIQQQSTSVDNQQTSFNSTKTSDNERDNSSFVLQSSIEDSTAENNHLMPYRLQLEGRRRLNTIERIRERRSSRDSLDNSLEQELTPINKQNDESNLLDPITRRALERFDEKNRQPMNYNEIQDPITRRALMRLESNINRSSSSNENNNENRFINSYTIPPLQTMNERSTPINNKTTYVSVHQRYCAPPSNNENQLEPQQNFISSRQRSRSEDMLSSRDLIMGQTTDLDQSETNNSTQLQRNRSSNQLSVNPTSLMLPNALIKTLEPNFVRTTESSVSYVTPTQTYSSYSCEYARPRRNLATTTTTSNTSSPNNVRKLETNSSETNHISTSDHDIVRPTPYRPVTTDSSYQISSNSAFSTVRPTLSTNTSTTNHYSQPQTSYTSSYNNTNNTSVTSEDPIIRRALERFNSKVQNSLMSTSQYPTSSSNVYSRNEPNNDFWSNRSTSNNNNNYNNYSNGNANSLGYQSIIGRRRQTRYDERPSIFRDQTSVGDGYTSSMFVNAQQIYPSNGNHFENSFDEPPPAIPPRFRRENYRNDELFRRHSTDDFLSENVNNNNNSSNYGQDSFVHHAYPATVTTNATSFRPIQIHYNHQYSSQENNDQHRQNFSPFSTDSSEVFHSNAAQRNSGKSPDASQIISETNPSSFHRMTFTGNRAMLSKSSSNLLNRNSSTNVNTNLRPCEIELDESSVDESLDKFQRSKSSENRNGLKISKTFSNENDEENRQNVSAVGRRKSSNGNLLETEQEKMSLPVQRYLSNNVNAVVQSASSASVNNNGSKSKPPVSIPVHIDRRDSNSSNSETSSRFSKRNEENRPNSSTFHSRQVPVSVFSPAKIENKRFAPTMSNSQTENQSSSGFVRSATLDLDSMSRSAGDEIRRQNPSNGGSRTPTNILEKDLSSQNEKHESSKKLTVFERLFRGNRKKN